MLAEAGKLSLDDPLTKFVPEPGTPRTVTLRQSDREMVFQRED